MSGSWITLDTRSGFDRSETPANMSETDKQQRTR